MNWFEIIGYGSLLYIAASLRIIGPEDLGCLLLFGEPRRNVSAGLCFVPFGIYSLRKETALLIQDELPAEPEKIYRGSEKDPEGISMPPELEALGMRPPIRVTFSGRNAESIAEGIDEEDPYDRRLTEEVVPVVSWKILNYMQFLQTVGSIEQARRQMEDACVEIFTVFLTKVTPAVALRRMDSYSKELEKKIDELVKDWGIDVTTAQIKGIHFSKTLNTAVQNVVVQERQKKAAILEGQGLGGKQQAILDGRTAGLKKMMDDLHVEGTAVLGAETARAIAGEGDKSGQKTIIAGSGGFADLIGTAVAIGESLKSKGAQP